jgi:hypothetical protein
MVPVTTQFKKLNMCICRHCRSRKPYHCRNMLHSVNTALQATRRYKLSQWIKYVLDLWTSEESSYKWRINTGLAHLNEYFAS